MGIPKFFRYISERYPLVSQLIDERSIPEFDNLYLDSNGIIHNCTHPDDYNELSGKNMSEAEMFLAIFAYIDKLFACIRPSKVFFIAIDGVAPRAKMNQQRSRRFRSAQDAMQALKDAQISGKPLPEGEIFDSNCITPGTPFMQRLSDQLKYFINKKVSEDASWQGVEVILSGHEVPGEGEHKIQEYIRTAKAQPQYSANTRHCLYGLDADLFMLSLVCHDPHFCLLREEITFGPSKAGQKKKGLDHQNFFLLHISLLREYLDIEFSSLTTSLVGFEYNLERVIDDFVLLCIFIGNDFLPHLPGLHINEGALNLLFTIYRKVLPSAGGYLNENGVLNAKRLQLVIHELQKEDLAHSEKMHRGHHKTLENTPSKQPLVNSVNQSIYIPQSEYDIVERITWFVRQNGLKQIAFPTSMKSSDRSFFESMSQDLGLFIRYDGEDEENSIILELPDAVSDNKDDSYESATVEKVLARYEKFLPAENENQVSVSQPESESEPEPAATNHMKYYMEKLHIKDQEGVQTIVYRYIEGLQWVLTYYYAGVPSWSWFYDYHYSPKVSDMNGLSKFTFNFELGEPFKPFEQLMGVLPEASKIHVPEAYRDLMYSDSSSILDFYPRQFELDLNGKKQDWEAVVKIPFIDQNRLLQAMAAREHRLTSEERKRNTWGPSRRFTFDQELDYTHPSSLPGIFPAIFHSKCRIEDYDFPTMTGLRFIDGMLKGTESGLNLMSGFPTLKTLDFETNLAKHNVNVFQAPSRNETVVIKIRNDHETYSEAEMAKSVVGKTCYYGWPFLREGYVHSASSYNKQYLLNLKKEVMQIPLRDNSYWLRNVNNLDHKYSHNLGVIIGETKLALHVLPLIGMKYMDSGSIMKEYAEFNQAIDLPAQMMVRSVKNTDPRYEEKRPQNMKIDFPPNSYVFFLGEQAYGAPAIVIGSTSSSLAIRAAPLIDDEEEFSSLINKRSTVNYVPSSDVARSLGFSPFILSKITSSMMILHSNKKTNIGLSLKFEGKSQKVLGYAQKTKRGWEYSQAAITLLTSYQRSFPEIFSTMKSFGSRDLREAIDIWPAQQIESKISEIKAWMQENGVNDFEVVGINADGLDEDIVRDIEALADSIREQSTAIPEAFVVTDLPRQAVLKPSQAHLRLNNQKFNLGDRVVSVSDSGNVPLGARGTVVGLNALDIDVIIDIPHMAGTTLDGRCSAHRGATVAGNTILNTSSKQLQTSTTMESRTLFTTPALRGGRGTSGMSFGGSSRGRGTEQSPNSRHLPSPREVLTNGNSFNRSSTTNFWRGRGRDSVLTEMAGSSGQNHMSRGTTSRGRGSASSAPTGNFRVQNNIARGQSARGRGNKFAVQDVSV